MVQPVLPKDEKIANPGNKALFTLALLAGAPLIIPVPANLNVILTATVCVFSGCWKSVKAEPPADSMSHEDAVRFPLIGSAVLLGLFLLFKFLPKELINTVLTGYFVLIGAFAVTVTLLPFVEPLFTQKLREKRTAVRKISIPYIFKEPLEISFSIPEIAAAIPSSCFCLWYFAKKHWFANNVLGLAFSVQGIEHLSIGSVTTGIVLLGGLFIYDIFWVFCTPVMVSVAKSFDAPIKLLFPRNVSPGSEASPFSMLGLGDIVIPGVFVALLLRYDALHHFKTKYFYSAYAGYSLGLVATILVMNIFQAAQPALLYIVPAVLGAVGGHALQRKEIKEVLAFSEAKEKDEEKQSEEAPDAAVTGSTVDKASRMQKKSS